MTRSRRIWVLFPMLFGLEGILAGQAMIEYGLGANRSATGAAAAGKGVSTAVGGIMDSLNKVLKTGEETTTTTVNPSAGPGVSRGARTGRTGTGQRATVAPSAQAPAEPAKIYEDPTGIRVGMANDELMNRFGPPALETNASNVRTLTYWGKSGIVQLDLRDQKVSRLSATKPEQAAVVLPSGRN